MTQPGDLLVRDADQVRWITLNRPESKNSLTYELNEQLIAAFREATVMRDVRAVALGGAGGAFCSGLDLSVAGSLASMSPSAVDARLESHFHGLIRAVRACPKPVVAIVDGAAAGFGCDLALACDLRICSDRARFGEVFVKRGLMPDGGGTFSLPRLVGVGRALELFFTGDLVDAHEAFRIGLANRVVPVAELEATAAELMKRLASGPPLVNELVKRSVYAALGTDLDAALDAERRGQVRLIQSKDFAEGVSAFFQKRPPVFRGE